jgi:hypothetical protein
MGSYVTRTSYVLRESAPVVVWFMGWVVLLLPLGVLGFWWLAGVFR